MRTDSTHDGVSGLVDQLVNRILGPLGLVILSRERIQQTLDEAAERGRMTRSDATELASLLIQRGSEQTEQLLPDLERLLGRGRERLARSADTARRRVGVGPAFPIVGYDELTAAQVRQRLPALKPAELRKVRTHERRHANRKTVLSAVERRLG